MNKLRIVFMGTPDFAATVLESLIINNYNIVLAVTKKDALVGRKKELQSSSVKNLALKYHLEVFEPTNIKLEYQKILDAKPDLIITCAYGQIIPKIILDYPKYRCINIHGSLLPKYRGAAPIQRAIEDNLKKTGITIMYMEEKMDAGDMLFKKEIKIEDDDTTTTLFNKMATLSAEAIIEFLPKFLNGDFKAQKQDESEVSFAKMIKKADEYLNFNQKVDKVYAKYRSLTLNPGAYATIDNYDIKFYEAFIERNDNSSPGLFYGLVKDAIKIGCLDGFIYFKRLKLSGKKEMDARSFYNGLGQKLVNKRFEIK